MKLLKDNWMFLAAAIALVTAFLLGVHGPQQRRLNDLGAASARTEVALEADAIEAARVPRMLEEVERLKQQFQDFDRRLPGQQELAEFLREIAAAAGAGQLHGQVIQPGSPTSGPLYDCLPIVMQFDCTFTDLAGFLGRLSRMTRLSRIERLSVEPDNRHAGQLHVDMQINIYFTES